MLFKSTTAVAILAAAASQVVAEPSPYFMSTRSLFGLSARSDDGYAPSQNFCGQGNTCAEACGAGFQICSSTDNAIHCFNATQAQVCCPNGSGNSCDAGYYCAQNTAGDTVCCPEGQTLEQCSTNNAQTGGLVSQTAAPVSSSTSSSSSSSTLSSSSSSSTTTSSLSVNTTTTHSTTHSTSASATPSWSANATTIHAKATGYTTTTCSATGDYTATFNGGNYTSAQASPSATATEVALSGAAALAKPMGVAIGLVAAGFAILL